MQSKKRIVVGMLACVLALGGSAWAYGYASPSLTSLYTQVAYLGFQVQSLLQGQTTQNQQIQAMQAQIAALGTESMMLRQDLDDVQDQLDLHEMDPNAHGGAGATLPWLGLQYVIALQGVFPSRSGGGPVTEVMLGEIRLVPYNFVPAGYAACEGQLLQISQYQSLFSLLGTTYGGDGRVTFGLPDLRSRVVRGVGQGPGLPDVRLGEKGGG